ncbi:JAB domain-containing protein [Chitinophaga pollutisoli]|uniref:JAB domain-containing protein n=1 Tax=Chitinophaga pollutisoli TaxID=3133966 RepID=A0ABZ2YLS8_9BACT|nr:JAB domain-containing protein [Chitinophaga rhizosphaerae]
MAVNTRRSFQVPEIILKYLPKVAPGQRETCNSIDYAFGCFIRSWNTAEIFLLEEFKVLLLDHSAGIIGLSSIGKGGRTSVVVDIRMILLLAIKAMATKIIVAHNHPSGNIRPSRADIRLTDQLSKACKIVEIELVDHLIIAPDKFFSFREDGSLSIT